jgi:large subunit ribosomal protein L15
VKSHDLRPAPGSRTRRTRVGRGIAAGKGKTAGRGTKGQRSRAGASIPSWFEGGQTPIHIRIPKLRGFKRYGRIEYQVVNVGRIGEYARAGRFGDASGTDPITVNAEVLRGAGLVSSADKPLKILGNGDVDVKLFVAAEAFTASARTKIESAGGYVQSLAPEKPSGEAAASVEPPAVADEPTPEAEPVAEAEPTASGDEAEPTAQAEPVAEAVTPEEPADERSADESADTDRAAE